jgi:hypothetical protein
MNALEIKISFFLKSVLPALVAFNQHWWRNQHWWLKPALVAHNQHGWRKPALVAQCVKGLLPW